MPELFFIVAITAFGAMCYWTGYVKALRRKRKPKRPVGAGLPCEVIITTEIRYIHLGDETKATYQAVANIDEADIAPILNDIGDIRDRYNQNLETITIENKDAEK